MSTQYKPPTVDTSKVSGWQYVALIALLAAAAIIASLLVGCGSIPTGTIPGTTGPKSGESTAGGNKTQFPVAAAVLAAPGTAKAWAPNTDIGQKAENSVSGHLITGLVLGVTPALVESVREDPVLMSIAEQIRKFLDSDDWATKGSELKALRDEYAAARAAAMSDLKMNDPPTFDALKQIVVVGWIAGNAGHTERQLTADEAKAIYESLSQIDKILEEENSTPPE